MTATDVLATFYWVEAKPEFQGLGAEHMTHESYRFDVGGKLACRLGVACVVLALAIPLAAHADAIIGDPVDWDTNEPITPWTALGTSATVIENTADADNFLEITFPASADLYETAKGPSGDLFALTWQADYWIEFDFWADSTLPDTLQVRWHGTDRGFTWGNTVTPSGIGSWGTLRTDSFSKYEDWNLPESEANEADFLADLGSIDWIGAYIYRDGSDKEIYGVDDFKLMVPEPEEYLMLAAALITALLVMRRQKMQPEQVKAA